MQTRSNLTGDLSCACSMRNFGRWSRTAVCSSMGIFTSPNEIDPFHSARGIVLSSQFSVLSSKFLSPGSELAFRFDPVVELQAVSAAAFEVALIRAQADV